MQPLTLEISQRPEGPLAKRFLRRLKEKVAPHTMAPWPEESYSTVDLTFWRWSRHTNFGDELSKVIVSLVLAREHLTIFDEVMRKRQLLAIGSILHFARENAVVWGTGINGTEPEWRYGFKSLDVRAVRGPYTAEFLRRRKIAAPEVFGDPALLLPDLVGGRFSTERDVEVGFVPNHLDADRIDGTRPIKAMVIDPRRGWNSVVRDILRCKKIIATSLHGLVIAEAFGIPARYVRLSATEGMVKYRDYYAGTGREQFAYASSIAEALEMPGESPPIFDRDKLLQAFPYDIWTAPI